MGDSLDPSKLKVAELRAELQARGLDTKGNKPVLVERLKEALEQANDEEEADAGDFELEPDHDEQDEEEDEEDPDAPDPDSAHENEPILELEPEREFEHEAEHDEPALELEPEGDLDAESEPEPEPEPEPEHRSEPESRAKSTSPPREDEPSQKGTSSYSSPHKDDDSSEEKDFDSSHRQHSRDNTTAKGDDIAVKEEVDEYYKTGYEDAPMQDMSVKEELGNGYEGSMKIEEIDVKEELLEPKQELSDSEDRRGEKRRAHSRSRSPDSKKQRPEVEEVRVEDEPEFDKSAVLLDWLSTTTPSPMPSTSHAQPPAFEHLTPVEESKKRRRRELVPAMVQGFDGTRWHKDPNPALLHMFTPLIEPGGPTSAMLGARKISDFFSLFLDDQMLAEIVLRTNELLAHVRADVHHKGIAISEDLDLGDLDLRELKGFIGILIMSAVRTDNHTTTSDMWDPIEASSLYLCTMTESRFALLARLLRFDNSATRAERRKNDLLAPIRKLFDHVVANCQRNYRPGPHLTVGDQFVPFTGRCPFKVHIPNKPAKIGMKLMLACDANTHYMCNAIAYLGKNSVKVPRGMTLGEVFMLELVEPFHQRGRTVTTDEYFTTLPLALALADKGMHLCGTICQKPYVPEELCEKVLPLKGSVAVFNYEHNLTLHCQQVTRTKKVVLMSSLHHGSSELEKRKTDIQMFYNSTKGGVHTFNQLCATSNCIRETRRWPLCFFYWLLNIIMVNSYILYSSIPFSKTMPRRKFLKEVAIEFCAPQAKHRFYTSTNLSKGLQVLMLETFKFIEADPRPELACGHIKLPKRIRCKSCPSKDDHKTNTACSRCKNPVCLQHQTVLCPKCT